MNRISRALSLALCLVFVLAAAAHAVGEGRVVGVVNDPNGKPLKGIKVTLSRPGSSYKVEKVTDANGKFTLLVIDATQQYLLQLEKEGYAPYEETIKPRVGDTLRLSYTLGEVAPAGPSEEEIQQLEGKDQAVQAYNEGVVNLQAGNLAAAAPKFEEATKLDPSLALAFAALAEVSVELGKHAEALAAADSYLALDPTSVRALSVRFDALRGLDDKERMGAALDALVAADKSRETAVRIFNLGAESSRAGDREGAIAYFKRALEVDPALDQAYTALGQVLLVKKSYREAVQAVEPLLAREPTNLEALTIRYEALKAAGDKEGVKEAQEAMKVAQARQNPEDLYKQGVALYNAGNNDAAVLSLEVAVSVDPKHARAHYMLGLAYVSSHPAKAKEHLQKFVELAPKDPDAAAAKEMLTYLK
ncbi:MAG TPA: tetratricopeptide repeat protein [Thermoanaerobaculia bacterium]|nr:tetratricopeptide repeat protein [Thermoanaerobaculia bacterium]